MVCEQMQATLSEHLRRSSSGSPPESMTRRGMRWPGGTARCIPGSTPPSRPRWASPPAYAKLAASMADALESIGRKGGTTGDLASLVAALNPRTGTCPLCALLTERERSVITEITSGTPAEAGSATLCLRHLTQALAADPALKTGQAMVQALADALRRTADDMRTYALKREALHSGLLTEEESGAYLDTRRRLAGLPALSQP